MPLSGFFVDGVCQASQAEALAAFGSMYPQIHNGQLVSAVGLQFVAPDHVAGSLVQQNLLSGAYTWTWLDIPLVACDPALDPNQFVKPSAADIAYVFSWGFGAVVFFFFMGFVIGIAAKLIEEA